MSMIFKSYEESVENNNGEISKTSKMTTHNGKKGVEILTKNGKSSKKSFKVNKKTLPKGKRLLLPTIVVGIPIHKVNDQDRLTKKLKSQKNRKGKTKRSLRNTVRSKKFKIYVKSQKTKKRKKEIFKHKSRRKSKRKKTIKKKPFWKKLIGM